MEVDNYPAASDVCERPEPENEYQAKFSLYHCVAIALQDGQVKLDSFTEKARSQTADLRQAMRLQVVDPFASRYPVSWGSGVRVRTSDGETLAVERKDCKGDPELALDEFEMRVKAMDLMRFGGLSESEATARCDLVLSLPDSNKTPKLFSEFIDSIGIENRLN